MNSQKFLVSVTRLLIHSWQRIVCIRYYTRDLVLDQGISNVIHSAYPRNFRIVSFGQKYQSGMTSTPLAEQIPQKYEIFVELLSTQTFWELSAIKYFCLNIHSEQDKRSIHTYMCINEVPKRLCVQFLYWHHFLIFDTKLPNFYRLWKIESGQVTSM